MATFEIGKDEELILDIHLQARNEFRKRRVLTLKKVVEGRVEAFATIGSLLVSFDRALMMIPRLWGEPCRPETHTKSWSLNVSGDEVG